MPDQQRALVQLLRRQSRFRSLKRARLLDRCYEQHPQSQQLCPAEYVVYTRHNSAFFEFCRDTLHGMQPFCPQLCQDFLRLEFLSFYVVLFLCGDNEDFRQSQTTLMSTIKQHTPLQPLSFSEREQQQEQEENFVAVDIGQHQSCEIQHYNNVNQWVKVPFWYLAMWESYKRTV
jgi:hypothetical protein